MKFYAAQEYLKDDPYCQKTVLQILSTPKSTTAYNIKQIASLGFRWIDLNLGCPSKQVTSHHGGSYLLSNPSELRSVLDTIRENFNGFFSVKMRSGFQTSDGLQDLVALIESSGVDLITLHARNRQDLYRGAANWDLIKQTSKNCSIPVWGNGDICTIADLERIKTEQLCSGVMIGRGAIRRPWLASQWYDSIAFDERQEQDLRLQFIHQLIEAYNVLDDVSKLKKMKKLTHYLFDPQESEIKSKLLRSSTLGEFMQKVTEEKPNFKNTNSQ